MTAIVVGNQQIDYTTGGGGVTPADQYSAWASALGVSSTETLQTLDADDQGFSSSLAASFFVGGSTGLLFSSEAALGFYTASPSSASSTAYTIPNVSRMYGLVSRPRLLFTFHPESDLLSEGCKIQRSGTTTIIYGTYRNYGAQTYRFQAAIRITPQRVEFVGRALDVAVTIRLTELAESTATTVLQQATIMTAEVGSNAVVQLDATTIDPVGLVDAGTPLGSPAAFGASIVQGSADDVGPLGAVAAVAAITATGQASTDGVLGSPQGVGQVPILGVGVADSPLGVGGAHAVHDFTALIDDSVVRYAMDVVDANGAATRIPVSSWQATIRAGQGSNYVQCVIPSVGGHVHAIEVGVEFAIMRVANLLSGDGVLAYEMARSPLEQMTLDRGPNRHTATVSGYAASIGGVESPATTRPLGNVRSISVSGGSTRARADVDWLLRPGHTATYGDTSIAVAYINYYVNGTDHYMDVGG